MNVSLRSSFTELFLEKTDNFLQSISIYHNRKVK